MNSPKEIANRVLEIQERGKFEHLNFGDHQFKEAASIELARAYLELEKKLSLEQQDRESEKREFKVFKDAVENEITKLKKSREVLRKACEFYASSDQWNCTKEKITTYDKIDDIDLGNGEFYFNYITDDDRVGGKKAREAIKSDDEIMK